MKKLIPIFICLLCVGCLDAKVDPKINSKIDTKAEIESLVKGELTGIKAKIKNELKAEFTTNLNNKMNTKFNLMGGDIQGKIDKLNAKFETQIETHTQNQGMFSGGGIYVSAVAITLIVGLFGTIIWITNKAMKWKKIWHIASQTIEHIAEEDKPASHVKKEFARRIEAAGLHHIVNKNLEMRGFKKKKN